MPFDARNGRVMLSLGPLSSRQYCTYSCPFCYVGGDFLTYASLTIDQIIDWVGSLSEPIDIIYVSCDTDSFAPPREEQGVELLQRLSAFSVDLLFTTRACLGDASLARLSLVAESLARRGRMLVGCVSLAQLSVPHLEPKPIPSPNSRIEQLSRFRDAGLRSVLALRPFLPNVPTSDCREIVRRSARSVELVLGGVWYYDQGGALEAATLGTLGSADGIPHVDHPMDFDTNTALWHVFKGDNAERVVREACKEHGLPMFMRSGPAIEWLRSRPGVTGTKARRG